MPRPRLERPVYKLVTRKGKRKWYVTWTDELGSSRYASTGIEVQDPDQPCETAKAYLSTFARQKEAPAEGATIAELMDKRLEAWKVTRPRSKAAIGNMKSFHRHVKGYFGPMVPADIVPETILGYHAHRTQNTKRHGGGKPIVAITRELEELRSALLYAVANRWIDQAPKIHFPAPRPPRSVFMTRDQGQTLIDAAETAHLKLFLKIALTTGQRRGAILDLTWDRVDFTNNRLDFRNPDEQESNKKRGVCNVPAQLMKELKKAYKLAQSPYVIEFRGKQVGNIKKAFNNVAADAGLDWVTPHVCKHSVISWLAEDKWNVEEISDFTSTDIPTVRRVYRKVSPEHLIGLRDSLSKIVFGPRKRGRKRGINPTRGRNNGNGGNEKNR